MGADLVQLKQDVNSPAIKAIVDKDLVETSKFQFDGVPIFIVNGTAWYGVPTKEMLFRFIDDSLAIKK